MNIIASSPRLNWVDNLSNGIETKLIAMTPILSSIVSIVRHIRFDHMVKNFPQDQVTSGEVTAYNNMNKFTVTTYNWGRVQLVVSVIAGSIFLALTPPLAPAIALPVGLGILATGFATHILHLVSYARFSNEPMFEKNRKSDTPQTLIPIT